MIKSMTGYGRAERLTGPGAGQPGAGQKKITVEIKSLNGKQLDLSVRIPSAYREKEYEIRGVVGRALGRGKVDLSVGVEALEAGKAPTSTSTPGPTQASAGTINAALFETYYHQLRQLAASVGYDPAGEPLLHTILRLPDVLQTQPVQVEPQEWTALMEAVTEATAHLEAFRQQEGAVLMRDLLGRIDRIEALALEVARYEGERIETVRTRLTENLRALQVGVDANRFEQEVIFYLEKYDITEEKVRLKQHCDYFRTVAEEPGDGVGRKLGFIAQEIGREINTTGSKANHAQMQKLVVLMKDELEKIKEQLLNIL